MVALSIDTAANTCAVAVSDLASGKVLASISIDIERGHAEVLIGQIGQCLQRADVVYHDIERVISTIGPGSFTGVRVGLSCARAIALALEIPVIGISNLEACAAYARELLPPQSTAPKIYVIQDARRDEVYFQQFQNGQSGTNAMALSIDTLVKEHAPAMRQCDVLCGSGAEKFLHAIGTVGNNFPNGVIHRHATAPIEVVAKLGTTADILAARPEPLYLRAPDAKIQQGFAIERADNFDGRP